MFTRRSTTGPQLWRAYFGVTLLALAACSPYQIGPPPADPLAVTRPFTPYLDGMATVCVIRTSRLAVAVTFVVHDNDLLVGATRGPTWFCWRAEPGHHRITVTAEDGGQRFAVHLVARGRYYLDQGLDYRLGFVTPHGRWVDETSALALFQQSQHRVLQAAPAGESVLIGTDVAAAAVPPGPDFSAPPPGATTTR